MASTHHEEHHHGVGHIVPLKVLVATGVALLVLTIITVAAAKVDFGTAFDLPGANIFIAMLIAGLKASLVVLYFMHLRYDRPFNAFVFVSSVFFVMLFIAMALTDTVEYHADLVGGNAPRIQERLSELSTEAP